jgi:hypothetical protein
MNKYIAAFDGLKFSESTNDYAINLSKSEGAYLTGVFLDDKTYTSYKVYDLILEDGVSEQKIKRLNHEDQLARKIASTSFEDSCQKAGLNFSIHHDEHIAIQELLNETIYADLLIINNNENFVHHEEKYPSRFIKDVLSNTQCPILLTPEKYYDIKKIVFLFDGEANSVYALKMFNYLFPSFRNLPIEVLLVKTLGSDDHFPHNRLVKEFIRRHYENVTYTVLKGIPEVEIIDHLQKEKLKFVSILGAYRRTMLSKWFKSSIAEALFKNFDMPVFIAHHK